MTTNKQETHNVIPFIREFNHIAPADLENILETLRDNKYLSEKGEHFAKALWTMFIKETK